MCEDHKQDMKQKWSLIKFCRTGHWLFINVGGVGFFATVVAMRSTQLTRDYSIFPLIICQIKGNQLGLCHQQCQVDILQGNKLSQLFVLLTFVICRGFKMSHVHITPPCPMHIPQRKQNDYVLSMQMGILFRLYKMVLLEAKPFGFVPST